MAENIWTSLANQIAEATATAGQNVVAVHGRRHPASGIIIGPDAVVTASHALRREEDIAVILGPGKTQAARLVGRDANTDLAVLRLSQAGGAPPPRWGETPGLPGGELVVAPPPPPPGNLGPPPPLPPGIMRPS